MKRELIIGVFFLAGCHGNFQTKQEKAETAIKKHLHFSKKADSFKHLKFTKIDDQNTIGLIDGIDTHAGPNGESYLKTLYFQMDSTCTVIESEYVN